MHTLTDFSQTSSLPRDSAGVGKFS